MLDRERHATGAGGTVIDDLIALSSADLRLILNRICRAIDRPPADGPVDIDVDVLVLRRHAVMTELSLRELSVAPGRPAIWAV